MTPICLERNISKTAGDAICLLWSSMVGYLSNSLASCLQSRNTTHAALSVWQARWKIGTPFLSYKDLKNRQISKFNAFSLVKCNNNVWNGPKIISVLAWWKSIHFRRGYKRKSRFCSQWPWPSDRKFPPPGYFYPVLFPLNWKFYGIPRKKSEAWDGGTDAVQHLMWRPREGRIRADRGRL